MNQQYGYAMQLYAEGMGSFQMGDFRGAIERLQHCIQLLGAQTPDYMFFHLGDCLMYEASGKAWQEAGQLITGAISTYAEACKRNPYDPYFAQAFQRARGQYAMLAEWQAAQCYEEGQRQLQNREYSKAFDQFRACVDLQGPNAGDALFYNMGLCEMFLAKQAGDNASTLNKMEPLAHEAISYFLEAQKRNPYNSLCQEMINKVNQQTEEQRGFWRYIEELENRTTRRTQQIEGQLQALQYERHVLERDQANKNMWENRRRALEANSARELALMKANWHHQRGENEAFERELKRSKASGEEHQRYTKDAKRYELEYERKRNFNV